MKERHKNAANKLMRLPTIKAKNRIILNLQKNRRKCGLPFKTKHTTVRNGL